MLFACSSVRATAVNWSDGRGARASTCGMKRIVGMASLPVALVGASGTSRLVLESGTPDMFETCEYGWRGSRRGSGRVDDVGVGPDPEVLDARFRAIPALLRSGEADSVEEVGCSESRLSPLLPCTVGSQPFSPLCIVASSLIVLDVELDCCLGEVGEVTVGEDVDRGSGGVSVLGFELE